MLERAIKFSSNTNFLRKHYGTQGPRRNTQDQEDQVQGVFRQEGEVLSQAHPDASSQNGEAQACRGWGL